MTTLALVPARGGSKGIPGKNMRPFDGKPLFTHAVVIGLETCDRTYVTTDDQSTADTALAHGAYLIVSSVHGDTTSMLAVVQDALQLLTLDDGDSLPDVVVLLQPTQPLRTIGHVQLALEMLEIGRAHV